MQPQTNIFANTKYLLLKFLTVATLFLSLSSFGSFALAAPICSQIFSQPNTSSKAGALFLHEKDSKLHTSGAVEKQVQIEKRHSGITLQKPADKLNLWLNSLESISNKSAKSSWALYQVKSMLFKQYVIKPNEVPQSYYDLQTKIARERGHGDIKMTDAQKNQLAETAIKDQEKSLEPWIEFMVSPEMKIYPMWAKYWMFTGMTKLSKFNPEDGTFANRGPGTVAPFPELNLEAVGFVMESILKRLDKSSLEQIKSPELQQLINNANFGKMYGYGLKALGGAGTGQFRTNEGIWKVYKQGSNADALVKTLEGKSTGWCIANQATAQSYLENGDFHIYYSLDAQNKPSVPRLAIRMEADQIGEIRGVGQEQNFDSQITKTSILSEKMKEFGNRGRAYLKKDHDMRLLTEIDRKHKFSFPLSKKELKFLYETDREIEGFGHSKDPRIDEIKSERDYKEDFIAMLGLKYTPEEIALNANEIVADRTKYFHGDLDPSWGYGVHKVKLPEIVNGNLSIGQLSAASSMQMPKIINGNLDLHRLTSAEEVTFPLVVRGNIDLHSLQTANGLKLPVVVHGDLNLFSLTTANDLTLPAVIHGDLDLYSLNSGDGLKLPETVNGDLNLHHLDSAIGMKMPRTVLGDMRIDFLDSVDGLKLPETVGGEIKFVRLQSAKNMEFPKTYNKDLKLDYLVSAENVKMPETINGYLDLERLRFAKGLQLPKTLNGFLTLRDLPSADGLTLPKIIKGDLVLSRLTSAKGLVMPETVEGNLDLMSLTSTEGLKLPDTVNGILDLRSLPSAKGLTLPKGVQKYYGPQDF